MVVHNCNRLSARTRFLQTGNTTELCTKRLVQALYSEDNRVQSIFEILSGNIKEKGYFMEDGRISGYFDTKYMTILPIEQILHNFEDQIFFLTQNRSIQVFFLLLLLRSHSVYIGNV